MANYSDWELWLLSTTDISGWFLIISVVPYIITIIAIMRDPALRGASFYQLVLATAPGDAVAMITVFMPRAYPGFDMYRTWYRGFRNLGFTIGSYGMITMAYNRYLALIKYDQHNLWQFKKTVVVVSLQYLAAFVTSFYVLLPCCQYVNISTPLTLVRPENEDAISVAVFVLNVVIVMPLVILMYLFIVCKLDKNISKSTKHTVAMRLMIISGLSCLPYMVANQIYIIMLFPDHLSYPFGVFLFRHGTNLFGCLTPYLLLSLSTDVRNSAIGIFRKQNAVGHGNSKHTTMKKVEPAAAKK